MSHPASATMVADMTHDLRGYIALCEEVLTLTTAENQALNGQSEYQSFPFYQSRKDLLPRLKQAFILLNSWRQKWLKISPEERVSHTEVKTLFQAVQGLLMKVLVLDRENQQALLRRGLVPAQHLPRAEAQQPHFVASVYKRHSGC
jgi:hypothetical protein